MRAVAPAMPVVLEAFHVAVRKPDDTFVLTVAFIPAADSSVKHFDADRSGDIWIHVDCAARHISIDARHARAELAARDKRQEPGVDDVQIVVGVARVTLGLARAAQERIIGHYEVGDACDVCLRAKVEACIEEETLCYRYGLFLEFKSSLKDTLDSYVFYPQKRTTCDNNENEVK